jgi:signal transduction histidine kinase
MIRHNVKNGQITISIKDQALLISNTGSLEALWRYFWTFWKKSSNVNSILGLAIVKEIAEANQLQFYINWRQWTCFSLVSLKDRFEIDSL